MDGTRAHDGGADDVVVRDAVPADVAALERVLPSWGDHARQLANAAAGRRTFLVALHEGTPVGTVVVRWAGVPVTGHGVLPEIGSLAVAPALRGRGLGGRLVAAAEERVSARTGTAAVIHVAVGNAGARRLYARLGYREVGRRRAADEQELVLVRDLSAAPRPPR